MKHPNGRLWLAGGIAGVLSVACYILAIALPWPQTQAGGLAVLVLASIWPVLSICYVYALYDYVAAESQGHANRLAFVFAVAAFTTLLAMIVVQLAVRAGLAEATAGLDAVTADALRRGLRLVDHGLDVAWDILVGVALLLSGIAISRRAGLGRSWGLVSAVLGVALIALNAATFPWPPGDSGLVDIGPLIGLFVMALGGRLAWLGRRAQLQ